MRIRLAPGVDPERAIAVLNEVAGAGATVGAKPQHPLDLRDEYVRWAVNAERQVQGVLHREDARSFFDSPGQRDIYSMAAVKSLTPLINAELDTKTHDFREAVDYLQGHLKRMRVADGLPIVVDSMVLLHCLPLDEVNWTSAVKEGARVMIPIRVIEEIDSKKLSPSDKQRKLARRVLPWIEKRFHDGNAGPVPLREGATIELLLADRPRYRPSDGDEEILDVCHDVRSFAGSVKVMTDDAAMRAKATSEGVEIFNVPSKWRREPEAESDDPESDDR